MNTGISFRQASSGDLDEVMRIENTCFGTDAFSRQQIAYLMTRSKGMFLIAEHESKVAGYLSFIISRRHNTGRIYSIAVAPAHRGLGIADIFMDRTIAFSDEKNLRAVFLEVRTDNTAAIQLYKKKGFTIRSVKHKYYHDGASAYKMILPMQKKESLI